MEPWSGQQARARAAGGGGKRDPLLSEHDDPTWKPPKSDKGRRGVAGFFDWFYEWLERPVHASTLCTFRALYSLVMLMQFAKWSTMFLDFQTSVYTLPYPGVGWIKPVSPEFGNTMLMIGFVACFCLFLGFMTRAASVACFIIFAYLFHLRVVSQQPLHPHVPHLFSGMFRRLECVAGSRLPDSVHQQKEEKCSHNNPQLASIFVSTYIHHSLFLWIDCKNE